MSTSSKQHEAPTPKEKITIKFIPDEQTKAAMKQFETKNFKKKVEKDIKFLSRFRITNF